MFETDLVTIGTKHQIQTVGILPWASTLAQNVKLPIIMNPEVPSTVMDALSIVTTCAMEHTLNHVQVNEQCGRVYLVAVEPWQQKDPVFPVILAPLGNRFEEAYRKYVQHLMKYSKYCKQRKWWRRARQLCDNTLLMLMKDSGVDTLSLFELAYFVLKLQGALAWPMGKCYESY